MHSTVHVRVQYSKYAMCTVHNTTIEITVLVFMQVGVAAIQYGKSLGLRLIGTAGTEEGMKLVKSVGADLAFNHNDKDYLQHIKVSPGLPRQS